MQAVPIKHVKISEGAKSVKKLSSDTSDYEIINPRVMLRGTIGT